MIKITFESFCIGLTTIYLTEIRDLSISTVNVFSRYCDKCRQSEPCELYKLVLRFHKAIHADYEIFFNCEAARSKAVEELESWINDTQYSGEINLIKLQKAIDGGEQLSQS